MLGRRIRPNHSTRTASQHAVISLAVRPVRSRTDGLEREQLRIATITFWREGPRGPSRVETWTTASAADLWRWLSSRLSRRRSTWLWLREAARALTWTCFWSEWEAHRFSLVGPVRRRKGPRPCPEEEDRPHGSAVLSDPPVILSGWLDERRLIVLDLANWIDRPLDQLALWTGHDVPEPPIPGAEDAWVARRVQAEAAILASTVQRLCDLCRTHDWGVMRYTVSGQAVNHWRHTMGACIVIPPDNPDETRLARQGYIGGRVECYHLGAVAGPIYALDCAGAYCAVMATQELPAALLSYTAHCDVRRVLDRAAGGHLMASVRLETAHPTPVRVAGVGTVWAVGRYDTVLCGAELAAACQRGDIRDVHACAAYKLDYSCRQAGEYWWHLRQRAQADGDDVLAAICKHAPCALAGKFGQQHSRWVPLEGWHPAVRWDYGWHHVYPGGALRRLRVLAGVPEVAEPGGTGPYDFPAISAWITMLARRQMDFWRDIAGHSEVLYQCTDCIHVTQLGRDRLAARAWISEGVLGALRQVACWEHATYWGVNCMRLGDTLCAAGLSGVREEVGEQRWSASTWQGLAAILQRGPDGTVVRRRADWTPSGDYTRGLVLESGRVAPIRLATW